MAKATHWRKLVDKGYDIVTGNREQQLHYSEKNAKETAVYVRKKGHFAQAVHVVSPGINYWVVMYKRK